MLAAFIVSLVVSLASMLIMSRMNTAPKVEADEFKSVTADEGASIPVLFGTNWVGQNVVHCGNKDSQEIKK